MLYGNLKKAHLMSTKTYRSLSSSWDLKIYFFIFCCSLWNIKERASHFSIYKLLSKKMEEENLHCMGAQRFVGINIYFLNWRIMFFERNFSASQKVCVHISLAFELLFTRVGVCIFFVCLSLNPTVVEWRRISWSS